MFFLELCIGSDYDERKLVVELWIIPALHICLNYGVKKITG